MKPLPILWQRLVSPEGKTCDRCSATYQEMQSAVEKLKQALRPLGIEPTFEIREIDERSFKANPSESNRIWIAGRPMEEWLGASVGSSPCCSVCGASECRTVEVEGTTFETIPEELFLRAALVASAQLLSAGRDDVVYSFTAAQRRPSYFRYGCCVERQRHRRSPVAPLTRTPHNPPLNRIRLRSHHSLTTPQLSRASRQRFG
ncbi:MAG: DUF2703 domain-containing protein [Syntrophobacteraceae bacterium]|nr:DUF2703 domain-containing protein [Syntrophobacteraceae bacterium]